MQIPHEQIQCHLEATVHVHVCTVSTVHLTTRLSVHPQHAKIVQGHTSSCWSFWYFSASSVSALASFFSNVIPWGRKEGEIHVKMYIHVLWTTTWWTSGTHNPITTTYTSDHTQRYMHIKLTFMSNILLPHPHKSSQYNYVNSAYM